VLAKPRADLIRRIAKLGRRRGFGSRGKRTGAERDGHVAQHHAGGRGESLPVGAEARSKDGDGEVCRLVSALFSTRPVISFFAYIYLNRLGV
jgi:hypothetical protein